MIRAAALAAVSAVLLGACSSKDSAERPRAVVVFAAASLVTALDGIVADFEADSGAEITVSYAASATLAQQIISGAQADIFLSASLEWADEVARRVTVGRREDALGNGLVLVTPTRNPARVANANDLASVGIARIAIGEPESVPAGKYAREALTTLGLWDVVQPKIVYTMDVRQALLYAERGEVDAAIVYATDAAGSSRVAVVAALDEALEHPVRYSLVLLDSRRTDDDAGRFFQYLFSPEAEARFMNAGFDRLPLSAGAS